jgi:hypothetical protein
MTGWESGGPVSYSPWIQSGTHVSYDGAVLVPNAVAGGDKGPGTLNVGALYIQGQAVLPNAYLPLTGGTLSGNLFISRSPFASITLNNISPSQYSSLIGDHDNVHRWFLNIGNSEPEAGSNTGSNFDLTRYADDGTLIDTPLLIHRNTGNVEFSGDVTIGGNINLDSLALADVSDFTLGGGLPGDVLSTDGAGTLSWITNTGGGGGGGGAGYLPLTGGTLTGSLAIATTGAADFILDKGISGTVNGIFGKTDEINRWCIELGGAETETGTGNAGSNFNIKNYQDGGANIGTPFTINRSTGLTTITSLAIPNIANLNIPGGTSGAIIQTNGSGVLSFVSAGSVGIPEAPVDGKTYGRQTSNWQPVLPLTGGTVVQLTTAGDITVGGNVNTSSVIVSNNGAITFLDGSAGNASKFNLSASNIFSFFLSDNTGAAALIYSLAARAASRIFTFAVPVQLSADPATNLQAATKQYVDNSVAIINAGTY